jgi:exonuclease III
MRIVSWNILQGGGRRIHAIDEAIQSWKPDILILQEYRNGKTGLVLDDCCKTLGLSNRYVIDAPARKNCLMMASKFSMQCEAWHSELDPTLTIRSKIDVGQFGFELFAGHLPHKKAQVAYLETLLDLSGVVKTPALIMGDLNCGIPFEDSDTKTFDNTHLFQALIKQGWEDSWRSRHAKAREFSWISAKGNGYRYDHCLATSQIDSRIMSIEYDHSVREAKLSDHSALLLDVDIQ